MSILTRRILPIPSFRTPYVDVGEVVKPRGPAVQSPTAPATPAAPESPSAPQEASPPVQTPSVSEEAPRRRRNTRRPTTRPIDMPKPKPDPRKGGRKRHNSHTVRDVKIVVSVSREEAAIWHALAQKDERPMAEWIRRMIFDVARVAERPHPEREVAMGVVDSRNRPKK